MSYSVFKTKPCSAENTSFVPHPVRGPCKSLNEAFVAKERDDRLKPIDCKCEYEVKEA